MLTLMFITIFFVGLFLGSLIHKHIIGCHTYFKFKVNERKKPRESDDYYLLSDGGAKYLFTESEVVHAIERANKNPEDLVD